MGQDRLESVDRLYRAALNVEPAERPAFLRQACEGDESVLKEVESRLLLDEHVAAFVDNPTTDIRAALFGQASNLAAFVEGGRSRPFASSQVIADRFQIVEFIGEGGMGDVYEAKDQHLGEHVALKTIRTEFASDQRMIAQFKQEILLAKKVTHPNVCRIYDVGFHSDPNEPDKPPRMFLTMELLRGETLASRLGRGPMSETEALPIIEQMAAGLSAAHQAGIVHRDFKSANVILVPGGDGTTRAVITDFGLARTVLRGELTTLSLTRGAFVGTPAYMAPEQVTGSEITPAVDIYALGVVAYEMVSGKLPFEGDNSIAIATKRLVEDPPSPREYVANLDPKWEATILRCLERQPSQRFASATEAVQALAAPGTKVPRVRRTLPRRSLIYAGAGCAGLVAGSTALWRLLRTDPGPSIAVLPFVGADSTLEYLSDGITEDVINTLGQRTTLRVMSRAAVYHYKGRTLAPQELGRALNVRFLLTGRIGRNGDHVSVGVELTDTDTGLHLWGQEYERRISEISAIEEDVCREVLGKLNLQWGPEEQKRLAGRSSVSAEANELYWRGRFFWNKRTQEGLKKGIEYFEQAVAKDPNFALAYTGLADCYAMQSGIIPPTEVFPKAKAAAQKALALDETLAEAHASLAFIHLFYDWDWLQTDKQYRRAIQLNPNYPTAHSMRGMYLVAMSRFDEALVEMRRALELDPASVVMNNGVGRVLFYARRYREAAEQYNKTLELNPDFSDALIDLGKTLAAEGKPDQAIQLLQRKLKASADADALAEMVYVHRRAGRASEAEQWVQSLQALSRHRYVSPYFLAIAQIGASNESVLDLLEQAYRDRSFSMIYLNVDPHFDQLRTNPRYRQLLHRLKFIDRI